MRFVLIMTIRERNDSWHAGIWIPGHAFAFHGGIKTKNGVFLVQAVIVAAGKKGTDKEPRALSFAQQSPRDLRELRFVRDEDLLPEASAVLELESPARPRIGGELFDAL